MRRINWTRLWDGALFFGMGAAIIGIVMWMFILATN
jgi:hypothetical protein